MTEVTANQVVEELRLTPLQVLTVRSLQARMLMADLEAERKDRNTIQKTNDLHRFVLQSFVDVVPVGGADWLPDELENFDRGSIDDKVELFVNLAASLAPQVHVRSAALVILVELLTLEPWTDGNRWDKKTRESSLELAAQDLGGLKDGDLKSANGELESVRKALRLKSIKWGRVVAATAVGAGVGIVTAGWAAPAIGAAIGSTMGLTGAAATSAGLAALGGGSLAAGGFGVAGGTMLLTGIGGVAIGGAVAAGTGFSPLASQAIAAEAVKLDLIAKLVLADSPNRDEKVRRVVESLQENINTLTDRTRLLVEKIDSLRAENAQTKAENSSLKAQIEEMKVELRELRSATTTLTVVRDRLPAMDVE
ncbi:MULTISPECIES: cell division protein ZapB [Gordonia]|uniref:cell division protein ZapB n=1 Tax=Gordonia TaxID=2053 RepID=UPI00133166E3|nr:MULTISPECIES: cell division protein ZapB [Gordonia]KAF0969865.1 hypothetical protein BPODLACK_01554 [Gordonia sp. YY1]MCR8897208.1 cell division protein ZapB [Gordonia sp. GONU]UPW14546.1 cell division protein ZapB [Gordonia amicalis]